MKISIVGGGITGLTVAHQLLKKGYKVVVYEHNQPGGLAGGVLFPGTKDIYLDKYYHHIFKSDIEIIRLIEEHGLGSDLMWLESKSGIFTKGHHWPFGTPRDLLSFSPIGNLWQRLLMGVNLFYFKCVEDWQHLDSISCREFFEQRWNLAGYRNLWEPLLQKKFGDAFDNIPASFLWGRIHPRAQSREKGRETLGYLRGGFQRLILTMVESIRERGGMVVTDNPVQHIIPGNKPQVVSKDGDETFDRVVWTISLDLLSKLVKDIPLEVVRKAKAIEYIAVTCLVIVMNKQQGNFYWLNNMDPGISFGAVIEHTNLASPEDYGGNHILYVVNYHRQNCNFDNIGAEQNLDMHLPSLHKVFHDFRQEDIDRIYLFKNSYSSPLYNLRFLERIPPYQGWLPNVDICGMAQVYPEDRNMNHCVRNTLNYIDRYFG